MAPTYVCLGMRDLAIFNDDPSRRRVVEVLRQTRPQLVLTSSPVDYLCDHEAASALVRDACFAAPAPNYHTGAADPAPPLEAIPHLYWMDPVGGEDREGHAVAPDFVVNVAETFARKREMLSEHCQPAGVAAAASRHGRLSGRPWNAGRASAAGRRGSRTAKDSASIAATPTRKVRCSRNARDLVADGADARQLRRATT